MPPRDIKPLFDLTLICNDIPKASLGGKAFWNRVKIIPFQSVFVDIKDLPKTEEEQEQKKTFLKDPDLMDKLDQLAAALLWYLVYVYRRRLKSNETIHEPEAVRIATKNYKTRNNMWYAFITEKLDETVRMDEKKAQQSDIHITMEKLWDTFNTWFKNSYPNVKNNIYNKMDVKDHFIKRWGDPEEGHYWRGISIKKQAIPTPLINVHH